MRIFKTSCIDEKTGYEIILGDAGFDEAMDWLQKEVMKYGAEICRQEKHVNGLWYIWTAQWDDKICNYKPARMFYYSEERMRLLGG